MVLLLKTKLLQIGLESKKINRTLIQKLESIMGADFQKLKGRGTDKKFLTWLTKNVENKSPRFKVAIKEEMESSKFGIF